jgi:hypothetical protein
MPDFSYIDQVFDRATPGAAVSEEDASAVENLYRQDNEEEEEKKPQQQVSQPETGRVAGQNNTQQRGGLDMIQGAAKWVEENIGIPVEDIVDNVFQGNQRTPDQVAQDRAGRRESLGQQLQQQKTPEDLPAPLRGAVGGLREVGGVIAGGMTGAAESTANTAEIAGDTARYFATLGNVKEAENPFSNKYEWASWDLGKAEAGAQTGAGKVAQGFLEFGILMAGTGGFSSLPAAGAKFAAAGTALGKAGVVAKAGAYGAAAGLAADMMSATRGEGNLSNLIKEHAPEWYPTFLTALAVDEDDSPWEAMLKTGLEGMGIGFAADAVGAFISGSRAARRVLKAGGTEDEAAQVAVQEAQEAIELTTPASSGSFNFTKPTTPEEYVQALEATKASNPTQYWSVDGVDLDSASKGKIISVEGGAGVVGPDGDIKGVFKDVRSDRKGVADEVLQEAVRQGGIKLDNFDVGAVDGNPGYLTKIYERNGFRQVGRTPFNAEFAPPGWDEALHGRPDVVAMVYDPRRLIDMTDEARRFTDYDEMIAFRDSVLDSKPELRMVKDQLAVSTSAKVVTPLPNGNSIIWRLTPDDDISTAYKIPEGTRALEVTWGMGGSDELIGAHGTRVYRDFQRIAREELEPGTIVYNSPAGDTYSRGGASAAQTRRTAVDTGQDTLPDHLIRELYVDRDTAQFAAATGRSVEEAQEFLRNEYNNLGYRERSRLWETYFTEDVDFRDAAIRWRHGLNSATDSRSIRERLYTRAGFGPVNGEGIQAAVVRNSPDGRGRWLEPIADFDNPDAVIASINGQRHYLQRADDMLRAMPRPDVVERLAADLDAEDIRHYQEAYPNATPEALRGMQLRDLDGQSRFDSLRNTAYLQQRLRDTTTAAYREDARHLALQSLTAQAQRGIPVTWDDAAAVVPDMFTPGARQIDGVSPRAIQAIQATQPGLPSILDPITGESRPGYAVAIDFKKLEGSDLMPEDLESFIGENLQILSREDVAFKASVDDGVGVVELVRIVEDPQEARFLANLFDRPSIDDAGAGREIPLGGADSLRGTQGQHLASRFGTPMESRTVTPEEAIAQQVVARSNPGVRGGAQRMVTNHQLERIARSIGDAPTQILRDMVRNNPIDLEELSHLSKMSADEVVADAARGIQDALGIAGEVDFDKILRMNVDGEELLSRAGIVQVRGLMQEVTTRLYDSAYNIMKLGDVDMDVFPQVERMATDLKALMRVHKVSANTYSKLLSDHKLRVPVLGIEIPNPFKAPSVEELAKEIKNADKVLDDIVKGLSSGDTAAKQQSWRLANALMLAEGDPSKMPALWRQLIQVVTGEGLSIMYNSMLSGPKTHLVNATSNAINTIYRPLSAFAGGDAAVKKAAVAGYYNFHKTLGEAVHMSWKTLKDGPVDDGSKGFVLAAETQAQLQILHRAAELSNDAGFKAASGFMDMIHGIATFPLFNWPSKLLTTEDEFFKVLTSRMEYNSKTMMEAVDAASGTAKPVNEVFKELLSKNYDEAFDAKTGAIKDGSLLAAAKDVTFQTKLEGPVQHFADFVNNFAPIRPFFPFVKTGHNIMVYAGTHVPVLAPYLKEYKAVMAGDDAYLKAIYKGREAFGWMIVLSGATASLSGTITGNGPADPNERKLWLLNNTPRSIKVGDKWVDYSRIEPFGQIISAVADLHYLFNSGKLSEDRTQYMAGYLAYAIASNFTNKTYMQGVVPLSRMLQPGFTGPEALLRSVADISNNFIPLSGARRSFANAMTPYKQEFNSMLDGLLYSASGGLAKVGATSYDWLTGEKVSSPSGGLNAFNPIVVQTRGKDRVKDALEDIEFDSSVITKTLSGVKLDRQHRSRLQQLMGGSGLRTELDGIVNHPNFDQAVEDFQLRLRGGERVHKENEIWHRQITRTIEKYRDIALKQVIQEFPELRSQIMETRLTRAAQRAPVQQTKPIDFEHLVNMPVK